MNKYLLIICFILGEKIKHKKVTCVDGKCKAQNRNIIDACSYICGNPTCDYISKNFCNYGLRMGLGFNLVIGKIKMKFFQVKKIKLHAIRDS